MKSILIAALTMTLCGSAVAQAIYVQPSIDRNGNYREGYYRSAPNSSRYDNLNAESNGVNAYSGKRSTQRDEFSDPPTYNRSSPLYVPESASTYAPRKRADCFRNAFTGRCE